MPVITRKILARLMTNEVAHQFDYLGHGAKQAFSTLQLTDVVIGLSSVSGFYICSPKIPNLVILVSRPCSPTPHPEIVL